MKLYYKSDYKVRETFTTQAGVVIDPRNYTFQIIFKGGKETTFTCSYDKDTEEYVNCVYDSVNNAILCLLDNHGLKKGILQRELLIEEPDTDFDDDKLDYITLKCLDVELVDTCEGVAIYDIYDDETIITNITADKLAAVIHAATTGDTIADTAEFGYLNSTFALVKTTWLNIKEKLKAYFDTIYEPKKASTDLYVTSAEKSTWSGKQDALTFSTDIETDKASTTKISAIKTFYDWAVGKFIDLTKIVTTWTATTLDSNIPSEKLVKDSLDLKADIIPANGSTSALRALFVARGATYNGDGTYSLGGLTDITESQMIVIYNTTAAITNSYYGVGICCGTAIRTSFVSNVSRGSIGMPSMYYMYANCTNLESIKTNDDFFHNTSNVGSIYLGCVKLHTVDNMKLLGVTSAANAVNVFNGCAALITAKIKSLQVNFSFAWSPLLSLASLQYLVTNRANGTTRITITVHPTVWGYLNDAVNYPTWNALLVDAVANQYIDFASA